MLYLHNPGNTFKMRPQTEVQTHPLPEDLCRNPRDSIQNPAKEKLLSSPIEQHHEHGEDLL